MITEIVSDRYFLSHKSRLQLRLCQSALGIYPRIAIQGCAFYQTYRKDFHF